MVLEQAIRLMVEGDILLTVKDGRVLVAGDV